MEWPQKGVERLAAKTSHFTFIWCLLRKLFIERNIKLSKSLHLARTPKKKKKKT